MENTQKYSLNTEKASAFYNGLKDKGRVKQEGLNAFLENAKDPEYAKRFYNALSQKGYVKQDGIESFMSALYGSAPKGVPYADAPARSSMTDQFGVFDKAAEADAENRRKAAQHIEELQRAQKEAQKPRIMTPEEVNEMAAQPLLQDKGIDLFGQKEKQAQRTQDMLNVQQAPEKALSSINRNIEALDVLKARLEEVENDLKGENKAGTQYNEEMRSLLTENIKRLTEDTRKQQTDYFDKKISELNDLYGAAHLKRGYNLINSTEERMKHLQGIAENMPDEVADDIVRNRSLITDALKNMHRAIRKASLDNDASGWSKFWSGMATGFDGGAGLTLGLSDLSEALHAKAALRRMQEGKGTTTDRMLINSLLDKMGAEELYEPGTAGQIGQGVYDSLEFMLDMAITGGVGGATIKGVKVAGKAIAKKAGKKIAKEVTETAAKSATKQFAQRIGQDLAASAVGSMVSPMMYNEALRRQNENYLFGRDENGEVTVKETADPESLAESFAQALLSNNISRLVERGVGPVMEKGLQAIAKPLAKITPEWLKFGNNFLSNLGRNVKDLMSVQGFLPEFGEEFVEELLTRALVEQTSREKELGVGKWDDLFSPEWCKVTAGSVAVIQAAMGLPGFSASTANAAGNSARMRKRMRNLPDNLREEVGRIARMEDDNQRAQALSEVLKRSTDIQRRDILGYITARAANNLGLSFRRAAAQQQETEAYRQTLMTAATDGETLLVAADRNGNRFAYNPVNENDRWCIAYPIEGNEEDGSLQIGKPQQMDIGALDTKNVQEYTVSELLGSLSQRQEAQNETQDNAIEQQEQQAARPDADAQKTYVAGHEFNYTDPKGNLKTVARGSRIVPIETVQAGADPNTMVQVAITKPGGSTSMPGVMALSEFQNMVERGYIAAEEQTEADTATDVQTDEEGNPVAEEETLPQEEAAAAEQEAQPQQNETETQSQDSETEDGKARIIGERDFDIDDIDTDNYLYVIHQTGDLEVRSIAETGLRTISGLIGTSEFADREKILGILETMRNGHGHRGSNSLVIMKFPKSIFKTKDKITLDDISDQLNDMGHELFVVPTQYIDRIVQVDVNKNQTENGQSQSNAPSTIDPRNMPDAEKERRGDMLKNAPVLDVSPNQITATNELSARKAAEKWWDEHVQEPMFYETEAGEVEINRSSVESSLAHRYSQAKLDAITSLVEGFENAVYLGTMPDSRERGVLDHYFAYPINYNGEKCYVFCRAMQDANKNRLYVHEVFVADKIEKGDTLQTAASKPHGGIALYKDILANVLDADKGTEVSEEKQVRLPENPVAVMYESLLSENEGNEAEAVDTAQQMVANKTAELEQARKSQAKGKTIDAIQAAKRAKREKVAALEKEVKFWKDVAAYPEAKRQAEETARKLQKRIDAQQRAEQARRNNPQRLRLMDRDKALGEPLSLEEYVLRRIATGATKFLWDGTSQGTGGLREHGGGKRYMLQFVDKNTGKVPEVVADDMEQDIRDNHPEFGNVTASEILDVIEGIGVGEQSFSYLMARAEELHNKPADDEQRAIEEAKDTYETKLAKGEIDENGLARHPEETGEKRDLPDFMDESRRDEDVPFQFVGQMFNVDGTPRSAKEQTSPLATKRQAKAIARQLKKLGLKGKVRIVDGVGELVKEARARLQSVFHGSPHDFEAFDFSHMGSGEGAQAYGWGGYVTEVEGIGRTYAEQKEGKFSYKGKTIKDIQRLYAYGVSPYSVVLSVIDKLEIGLGFDEAKAQLKTDWQSSLDYEEQTGGEYADGWRKNLAELESLSAEDFEYKNGRHLYHVEIPTEKAGNYLRWEEPVSNSQIEKIRAYLKENYRKNKLDDFNASIAETQGAPNAEEVNRWSRRGERIYKTLTHLIGDDKSVSGALSEIGFVGISYPAQHQSGGRSDNARNYVIFKESDMKITDHIRYEKDGDGEIAGATLPNGDVLLNRQAMRIDTPFHEFAHKLFTYAKRNKEASRLYDTIVAYAKNAPQSVKDYVSRNYSGLSEEAYLDEVFAWALSEQSEGGLEEFLQERGLGMDEEARTWYGQMWDAIRDLWEALRPMISNLFGKEYADLSVFDAYKQMNAEEQGKALYDLLMRGKALPNVKEANSEATQKQQTENDLSAEERGIVERAKADGTYLKSPNGKPTKLSPKQWAQVRTKAFKDWFGDWEKAARIEKLRDSKPIEITGNEIVASDDLNQYKKNALNYGKTLRGEYTNKDTGNKVNVSATSLKEVLRHDGGDIAHIQSVAAIPAIIENGIYIDTVTNEDAEKNPNVREYQYYVTGLMIGGVDYTVKSVVAIDRDGNRYYDHALTQIEKGNLLNEVDRITSPSRQEANSLSDIKDKRLLSILQTDSSKVVDENGEPLVVYHGTPNKFTIFDASHIGETSGDRGLFGAGFYFNPSSTYVKNVFAAGVNGNVMPVFLNIRNPYVVEDHDIHELSKFLGGISEKDIDLFKRYDPTTQIKVLSAKKEDILTENLKKVGYDGVKTKDYDPAQLVAFSPTQIKSATDNVGAFDAENPDIRFRFVGEMFDADGKPKRIGDTDVQDNIYAFAEKYGFDVADVQQYADSMRMENSVGANRAFIDMKRKVRIDNTDKSLGEFVKIFAPIKAELYEKFGDVDALNEKYRQRALDERNVMEAARKRVEEEAQAERKRLAEFEVMSDAQLDKAYLKAIEDKDEARMRDLVNEAARRNGYVPWSEFRMAHRAPSYDETGYVKSMVDVANNRDQIRESLNEQFQMNRDRSREESVAAIEQALAAIDRGENPTVTIYRAVPKSLKEGRVRNGDWVTLSENYAKKHGNYVLEGDYRIMKEVVPAENLYWDGNDINEWGYDDRSDYRYRDTKNNRKLNDLITRDDAGNIIPLSQRFNARKNDARYRFTGEKGTAAKTSLEARRQAALDAGAALGVPIVVEETPAGGRRRAKDDALGWYDTRTGAVHVNPGNHADAEDVQRTVLHEAVGHMGMRRLLERKAPGTYDTFLDRVYASMPAEARAYFEDYARRSQAGRDLSEAELSRIAADEYVAALAEVGTDPSTWQKVVALVREALRAIGFNLSLSDADIRALLYESKHNLESAAYAAQRDMFRQRQEEFRAAAELDRRIEEDEREDARMRRNLSGTEYDKRLGIIGLTPEGATKRQKMHNFATLWGKRLLDSSLPVKNLTNHLKQTNGGRVYSDTDLWSLKTTIPSKVMHGIDRFKKNIGNPLSNTLRDIYRATREQHEELGIPAKKKNGTYYIGMYLMAKHMPERNAWMLADRMLGKTIEDIAQKIFNRTGGRGAMSDKDMNELRRNVLTRFGRNYIKAFSKSSIQELTEQIHGLIEKRNQERFDKEKARAEKKGIEAPVNSMHPLTDEDMGKIAEKAYPKIKERFKKLTDEDKDFAGKTAFIKRFGMKPKEYVKMFEAMMRKNGLEGELDKMWEYINQATEFSLRERLESGLLSKEAYNNIMARGWKNYVPLRSWDERNEESAEYFEIEYPERIDNNSTVFTNPTIKAEGRHSLADNPLPYIFRDAETAIRKGEENRFFQAVAKLRDDNANFTYIFGNAAFLEGKETSTEKNSHLVPYYNNGVKTNVVFVNPQLAAALRGDTESAFGKVWRSAALNWIPPVTRFMSAMLTSMNPAFATLNLMRDLGLATLSRFVEAPDPFRGTWDAALFLYEWFKNMPAAIKASAKPDSIYTNNGRNAQLIRAWKENGGETGWHTLNDLRDTKDKLYKEITKSGVQKSLKNVAAAIPTAFRFFTEVSENSVRLAAFADAKRRGLDDQAAAFYSKEITTNFNRHSYMSSAVNPLFMFFNASTQGINRILQLAKENPGNFGVAAVGMMMAGFVGAIANAAGGGDDDDYLHRSFYVRANNLVVGKWTIPLAHGFRMFYGLGAAYADYIMGNASEAEMFYNMFGLVGSELMPGPLNLTDITAYNSVEDRINWIVQEGVGNYMRNLVPSSVLPFYDIYRNRDFMGGTISQEPFAGTESKYMPRVARSKKNVNPWLEALNYHWAGLWGFDPELDSEIAWDDQKGRPTRYPAVSASDIEYIIGQYAGGTGEFVNDMVKLGTKIVGGEDFTKADVPVLKKLYRPTDPENAILSDYYTIKEYADVLQRKIDESLKQAKTDPNLSARARRKAVNRIKDLSVRQAESQLKAFGKYQEKVAELYKLQRKGVSEDILKPKRIWLMKEANNLKEGMLRELEPKQGERYARIMKIKDNDLRGLAAFWDFIKETYGGKAANE